MQFEGALITEQGVTFAIAVVKPTVKAGGDRSLRETAMSFASVFPGVPVVLMWQDAQGVPQYWGRKDIVDFLVSIHMSQIPWQRYTVAA